MKKNKLAIAGTGVGLAFMLLLTGCTSTPDDSGNKAGEVVDESGDNPNHVDTTDDVISLLVTPEITKVPQFVTDIKLPEGWKVDPNLANTEDDTAVPIPDKFSFISALNDAQTCSLNARIDNADASNAGRGDLFISKSVLYQALEVNGGESSGESTIDIPFGDDKKLSFVTDSYLADVTFPNVNPETGEDEGQVIKQGAFIALRGLDLVVEAPNQFPMEGAPATVKAVPVVTIQYTCTNPDDLDENVWKELVGAIKLTNEG